MKWCRACSVYALSFLLVFVFIHSLTPADPRVRIGFKPFEPEFEITWLGIWYAVKKWRHLVWFAIFFPLVRSLYGRNANQRAWAWVFAVSFLIEFEECFVAGRHGRLVDLLPNVIGAALAWLALRWYEIKRKRPS